MRLGQSRGRLIDDRFKIMLLVASLDRNVFVLGIILSDDETLQKRY